MIVVAVVALAACGSGTATSSKGNAPATSKANAQTSSSMTGGHDPAADICSGELSQALQALAQQPLAGTPKLTRTSDGGQCRYALASGGSLTMTVWASPDNQSAHQHYSALAPAGGKAADVGDEATQSADGSIVMRKSANVVKIDTGAVTLTDREGIAVSLAATLAGCW